MKDIKYYVLGTKNSHLLKEYFDKYYILLLERLEYLKKFGFLSEDIEKLLKSKNKKDFILNADNSSLINYFYFEIVKGFNSDLGNIDNYKNIFKNELNIFFKEGINSTNLTQNKGQKIAGTNIKLTNLDNNPYNKKEAHPDHIKQGAISGNWGEKSPKDWLLVYEKTFNILKKLDEGIYDELNQIITKIIPLGTARGMHNSASYKECIGHLYMGYTIDSVSPEINNLEAIIHESSHNKLNLILQFDPIMTNNIEYKYYSSIRPDARHLQGVFLGYHAFAPTMYIIMKAYKDGFLGDDKMWLDKIVLYYFKTKLLQKVIHKYANLTEIGEEISKEIDYVIFKMDKLFKEINPSKETILKAKQNQQQHFKEVNKNYPQLQY